MRRLGVFISVLFVFVGLIAAPALAKTGQVKKAGVAFTFVSATAERTGEHEVTYAITYDVAAGRRDALVNGWPMRCESGPLPVEYVFIGPQVNACTSDVDHTGEIIDGNVLVVRAGETERFTLTVTVTWVDEPGFLSVGATGMRWQFAGSDKFWFVKITGQNKSIFMTPYVFADMVKG